MVFILWKFFKVVMISIGGIYAVEILQVAMISIGGFYPMEIFLSGNDFH